MEIINTLPYGSGCASCRRGSSLLKKGTGKLLRDIKRESP